MPSNYEGFHVSKEKNDGVIEQLAGVTVKVYDVDLDVEVTTLVSNGSGNIPAGSLPVAVGTRVRFRVENHDGLAGSVTQITT